MFCCWICSASFWASNRCSVGEVRVAALQLDAEQQFQQLNATADDVRHGGALFQPLVSPPAPAAGCQGDVALLSIAGDR